MMIPNTPNFELNMRQTNKVGYDQLRLILPGITAIGVRLSHASREGSALGIRLSNTWIICPGMGDNLEKLRIIPHRPEALECLLAESSGVPG